MQSTFLLIYILSTIHHPSPQIPRTAGVRRKRRKKPTKGKALGGPEMDEVDNNGNGQEIEMENATLDDELGVPIQR